MWVADIKLCHSLRLDVCPYEPSFFVVTLGNLDNPCQVAMFWLLFSLTGEYAKKQQSSLKSNL